MIAAILRERRKKLGISQRDVAAAAGVSDVLVSKVEAGHQPTPSNLAAIIDALDRLERDGAQPKKRGNADHFRGWPKLTGWSVEGRPFAAHTVKPRSGGALRALPTPSLSRRQAIS